MSSVVITGASSGIGKATAHILAQRGHLVFATARRLDLLREVADTAGSNGIGTIVPVAMDVRDPASIARAVDVIGGYAPDGVDVLVNNAGFAVIGPVETLDRDRVRDLYATNVLGVMDVTNAFLPQMRRRRRGRVITVSSVLGQIALPGTGAYGAAKFAVESYSDSLRMELRAFGIDVVLIEPGFTDTGIDTAPPSLDGVDDDYRALTVAIGEYTAAQMGTGASPERVAEAIARATTTRRPRSRYVVPWRFRLISGLLRTLPTPLADRAALSQLSSART